MSSQGPLSGGTFTDDATIGTLAWSSPGSAISSNDDYATASLGFSQVTHYLRVTNFGFTVTAGAAIDGIIVGVERNASVADCITDASVRLYTGSFVGSDKATATHWPTTDTYVDYGGAADVWGAVLTDTNINASSFGVGIAATRIGSSSFASIDHIRITVYYTVGGAGGAALSQTIVVGL